MKKKSKIESKQKMYSSDRVIDVFIEGTQKNRSSLQIKLQEKLCKALPEDFVFNEMCIGKDRLKEIWSKELGYDNNFIPQYISSLLSAAN